MTDSGSSSLQHLQQAYRNTLYRVKEPPLTIRIGQCHRELDRLLQQRGYACWCYITAANPGSEPLTRAANLQRQQQLLNDISQLGLEALSGLGQASDGNWPAEPSCLVPGLDAAAGLELGRRHGQLALVHGCAGTTAELLWCRT